MNDSNSGVDAIVAAIEPPSALFIGGVLGELTFFLSGLLFGVKTAIVIAAVAAAASMAKRIAPAAIGFAFAAVLTALAALQVLSTTTALFLASIAFGSSLALFARQWMRAHLAVASLGALDV